MTVPRSLYPEGSLAISRVCVLGATGLVGTALTRSLHEAGVTVTAYSRRRGKDRPGFGHWDPAARVIDTAPLEGADAVVNLAGENLAGRWSAARKRLFWSSRVDATALLARTLAACKKPPAVLLNASAVGYYGDRGEEAVYEDAERGSGFLAELCEAWEAATAPASEAGLRVVLMRFGVVLTKEGGALRAMLPAFRLGFGGRLGSGTQRVAWVTREDAVGATRFLLRHRELSGPVNVVAPESITNAQLSEAIGRVLHRPSAFPVPAFALKTLLGEAAGELLLSGANVRPRKLEEAGYRFEYPRLDDALEAILG